MKSRSHRVPSKDPSDDWLDGSWTVDCVCGVTFDDGEEMVNCDECGVWVHTRCSKFVKGEKSFACDKCKRKKHRSTDNNHHSNNNDNSSSRNDAEETEVAQLLVELPLKTIKLSRNNNPHHLSHPPPHRPRLWAERPMEERVHIQGVPGGDPALYQGLSSIFTSELWKCTGYVPKKFNFRYKEFPCWDKHHDDDVNAEDDNEKMADKGAGVLCSLSNETLGISPSLAVASGNTERKSLRTKKSVNEEYNDIEMQKRRKKQTSLLQPVEINSSKRKGDDSGPLKGRSDRKKSKVMEIEYDAKKKNAHPSKTDDSRESERKPAKAIEATREVKPELGEDDRMQTEASGDDKPENSGAGCDKVEALSSEMSRRSYSRNKRHKTEKAFRAVQFSKMSGVPLGLEQNDVGSVALVGEKLKSHVEDTPIGFVEVNDEHTFKRPEADVSSRSSHPNVKSEIDVTDGIPTNYSSDDVKIGDTEDVAQRQISKTENTSRDATVNDSAVSSLLPSECKVQEHGMNFVVADKSAEVPDKQQINHSEASLEANRLRSELKQSAETASKLGEAAAARAHAKLVSAGKSSSLSSTIAISKSFASEKSKMYDSSDTDHSSKREITKSVVKSKKDVTDDLVKDDDKHGMLQKTLKDQPNSADDTASKVQHPGRNFHTYSNHTSVEAKDSARHQSPKASSAGKYEFSSSIDECAAHSQIPGASHVQNKSTASAFPPKCEKVAVSSQSSHSKAGHSAQGQIPTSSKTPAGLSDEELALLLHQELNSSPRVPRVPRMRNAGSGPQLSSASATSLLIKRTPVSGGKDQYLSSRRKTKDVHKDGFKSNAREADSEARRSCRLPSSSDCIKTSDALTQVEVDNDSLHYSRRTSANATAASSGPSSSNDVLEHNVSSMRSSPRRNNSDEDTGTKGPVHQTLPGLIAEIMSKGKRMTYEELCNAVRPHWNNLRKHNGERYAYSSHSQAVLDCLRNRTEWARLVDRGPKTSGTRKRRKIDDDPADEDNDFCDDGMLNDVEGKSIASSREEFPKGKRKARKRRRLALQGRRIKDVRKRRKAELASDDEESSDSASNSSYESEESDGESQGTSTNSDDTATMS